MQRHSYNLLPTTYSLYKNGNYQKQKTGDNRKSRGHFAGLSMADTSATRSGLKKQGVQYYVAKKTLMRRAFDEKGFTGEMPELPGEVAMVWSTTDATAPARGIYEYGKKHKKATFAIVGGVFDGEYADAAKMLAIATIPPLPVLRGMFVNVINSPIQNFVIALNAIAEKKTA